MRPESSSHAYASHPVHQQQPEGESSSYWRNLFMYPFQGNGSLDNGSYSGGAADRQQDSFGSFFSGLPGASSFSLGGRSPVPPEVPPPPPRPEEPITMDAIERLPGNQECADCGASGPEWASTNQGTVICIDCAGVHRSLGAHISKVKSLRLDAWKPQEIRLFKAKGGNREVNRLLASEAGMQAPRPPTGAPRSEVNKYIMKKYQAMTMPRTHSMPMHSRMPSMQGPLANPTRAGTTCQTGVCFVEVISVEISEDRSRDLRLLGSFFLSLSVTFALGSKRSQPTAAKRMSPIVTWQPPERRELLWDCEERWLWCRVNDGEEAIGISQLAGEGRVDIKAIAEQQAVNGKDGSVEVAIDLFAPGGDEESDEEGENSRSSSHLMRAPPNQFPGGMGQRPPHGQAGMQPPIGESSSGMFGGLGGLLGAAVGSSPMPANGYPTGDGQLASSMSHYYNYSHGGGAVAQLDHPLHGGLEAFEEDPTDPAVTGFCCGMARLRITLIDMSGMASGPAMGQQGGGRGDMAHSSGSNHGGAPPPYGRGPPHGSSNSRALPPGPDVGRSRPDRWWLSGDADGPPPAPPAPPRLDRRNNMRSNSGMWARPSPGSQHAHGYQDQHMTL